MKKINPAILIALLYFVVGVLWVYLTDKLAFAYSPSQASFHVLKTYKGFLYIFITSLGLFLLVRQSHKKLRKKGEEYEVLFEENPNPMWVSEAVNFRFLAVNRAALEQYGYSRKEFLQLTALDIRPLEDQPDFLQAVQTPIENYLNFGRWRLLKKSGELVHVEIFRHKVIFQDKTANLTLALDITARLRAEEERNNLIQELTHQNLDLQQFAYITSHNLRAPIANIIGLVNLYLPENSFQENQPLIARLGESARNLDTVVRDLNDLLVIRTRQQEDRQVICFEQAFSIIQQSLQTEITASQARIDMDFSAAPEVVSVRSYALSIGYNLLANAIKYRSPDRDLHIAVRSYRAGSFICLLVQDNGRGIDLVKNRHKLFGMYQRFHQQIEGKGLGLHLVKTQIEAVGGSIAVESEPGKGTAFKVLFPEKPIN